MNPNRLLLLFLLLCTTASFSQKKTSLSDTELQTIAKTWGLIKYYHPLVSRGKIDADSLLLNALAQQQSAKKTIANWIAFLDTRSKSSNIPAESKNVCNDPDNRNFDTRWIQTDKNLDSSQKKFLNGLLTASSAPGTYYSQDKDNIRYYGKREKVYKEKALEENYRLLTLFRAWNVIEYFSPYKYVISKKWDAVLLEFIPKFRQATDQKSYDRVVMEFSGALEDTHSEINPRPNASVLGTYGAPFTFHMAEHKMVVTKPIDTEKCKAYGIAYGDVIVSIDKEPVTKIIARMSKYFSASNPAIQERDAFKYLFYGPEGSFTIQGYDVNNKPFDKTIARIDRSSQVWFEDGLPDNPLIYRDEATQKIVYSKRYDDGIGYIDFGMLQAEDIDSLITVMRDTKAIIFDLRNYNDNYQLLKILGFLLPEPAWFGISTKVDFTQPGKFCYQDFIIREDYKYIGKKNPNAYTGKVYVLINEETQSVQEMWSMIFKKVPGVTFVGSQTAGADGNKTPILLADGRELIFSGVGIFYPDKTPTQKIGIVPDVVVKPTVSDLQNHKDPVLDKALAIIRK